MSLRPLLAAVVLAAACGSLDAVAGEAVGLEVAVPRVPRVEVGATLRLQARAIDVRGNTVEAGPIVFVTPDTARVAVADDGTVLGRSAGTARIRAILGPLVSDVITVTVVAAS